MPIMDGFESTRLLREGQFANPIIGLTGNALDEQVSQFLTMGVDEVIPKPVKRIRLEAVLRQYGILGNGTADLQIQLSPSKKSVQQAPPNQQQYIRPATYTPSPLSKFLSFEPQPEILTMSTHVAPTNKRLSVPTPSHITDVEQFMSLQDDDLEGFELKPMINYGDDVVPGLT
jgi:CheY-like chemotaxis protein